LLVSGWVHPAIWAYHLFCAVLIYRRRDRVRSLLRWTPSTAIWTIATGLLIVGFLACSPLVVNPVPYREVFGSTLFPVGPKPLLFAVFAAYTLVIHAPLEEIFWRAVVTDPERAALPAALVGNAVFFGLLHAVPLGMVLGPPGILLSLPAAAAGAVWAFVTIRSRSVWPALVSHWGADAVILGGMWFFFVR